MIDVRLLRTQPDLPRPLLQPNQSIRPLPNWWMTRRSLKGRKSSSKKWLHKDNYKECEWVCHDTGACMLYVGFNRRYGATRAACLRH